MLAAKIQQLLKTQRDSTFGNKHVKYIIERVVKPKRVSGEFVAEQIPFTPVELLNEIFDNIPTIVNKEYDAYIAVLFTVEAAILLQCMGFKDIMMLTDVHDPAIQRIADNWGFEYELIKDMEDLDMKFDVVVGNPPYQDDQDAKGRKTSSIPLWFHFSKQAFKLVRQGGYVAFITPSSWLVHSSKINSTITTKKLVYVKIFEKSPFKKMTTVSTWIAKNEPADPRTPIPLTLQSGVKSVSPTTFLPSKFEQFELKFSILNKTTNNPTNKLRVIIDSRNHTQNNKHRLKTKADSIHKYPVVHTNTKTLWTDRPDSLHGQPKVIASKTGSIMKARIDSESSTAEIAVNILTDDESQSKILLNVLHSKIFRFLFEVVRHSSTIPTSYWRALPAVDLTRNWTDAELYEHFNLTDEEIALIEETIK